MVKGITTWLEMTVGAVIYGTSQGLSRPGFCSLETGGLSGLVHRGRCRWALWASAYGRKNRAPRKRLLPGLCKTDRLGHLTRTAGAARRVSHGPGEDGDLCVWTLCAPGCFAQ